LSCKGGGESRVASLSAVNKESLDQNYSEGDGGAQVTKDMAKDGNDNAICLWENQLTNQSSIKHKGPQSLDTFLEVLPATICNF